MRPKVVKEAAGPLVSTVSIREDIEVLKDVRASESKEPISLSCHLAPTAEQEHLYWWII